jgi:hypothetical protein
MRRTIIAAAVSLNMVWLPAIALTDTSRQSRDVAGRTLKAGETGEIGYA